jgi:hypothetical protein
MVGNVILSMLRARSNGHTLTWQWWLGWPQLHSFRPLLWWVLPGHTISFSWVGLKASHWVFSALVFEQAN